ncbi:hypothetical protein B0H14DRAFT_2591879 [Mycena olivaceomarginata]|nr:hypothetical protein B0H14DRAFT_2591879 [Mycena olivaceomarginata]
MAPTESQKSQKVRERDKNPPPMAEREDLDAQYLRFSDGKEGVAKILEYMKTSGADGDEGEEEEPAEVGFDFDKKEILAAVELLERLRKFCSELKQEIEESKVQTQILLFFSPVVLWASPEGIPYERIDCIYTFSKDMKTLLVFCDGTDMDRSLAAIAELDSSNDTQYAPKVLHLGKFLYSIKSVDLNSNKQVIFYQSGVGSEVNFVGDLVTGTTAIYMFSKHMDLSDLPIIGICQCIEALGTTMASKICDAYVFVAQNFEDGGSNLSLWVRGLLTCIQDISIHFQSPTTEVPIPLGNYLF